MEPRLEFVPIKQAFSVNNGIYFCLNSAYPFSVFSGITPDTGDVTLCTLLIPKSANRFGIGRLEMLLLLIFYIINLPLSLFLEERIYKVFCISYMASLTLMLVAYTLHESYQVKRGRFYSTGQYHSAEHMVINCYNDLKRIPQNIEEIKQYSNYSPDCGSLNLFQRILADSILTCAMITIPFIKSYESEFAFMAFILVHLVLFFIVTRIKFKPFESLFLNKPDDMHLEVALRGLSELVFLENLFAPIDNHFKGKNQ